MTLRKISLATAFDILPRKYIFILIIVFFFKGTFCEALEKEKISEFVSNSEDEKALLLRKQFKRNHPVTSRVLASTDDMNDDFDEISSKNETISVQIPYQNNIGAKQVNIGAESSLLIEVNGNNNKKQILEKEIDDGNEFQKNDADNVCDQNGLVDAKNSSENEDPQLKNAAQYFSEYSSNEDEIVQPTANNIFSGGNKDKDNNATEFSSNNSNTPCNKIIFVSSENVIVREEEIQGDSAAEYVFSNKSVTINNNDDIENACGDGISRR